MARADHVALADTTSSTWQTAASGALRAVFGLVWALNAYLTYRSEFAGHYVGYLHNAATNQPDWLAPWFDFWIDLVTPHASLFIWATRIIETLIAIGLLLGIARKTTYVVGALFSLLIWSTAEGFSGPYTSGATNLGPALVYVLLFIGLILSERERGRTPYSVDYYIEHKWPGWRRFSELASPRVLEEVPPRLPWSEQIAGMVGILLALVLLFASLSSAMNAPTGTPAAAAAAVKPLDLASTNPVANPRDAKLPPLLGTGDSVDVTLVATDTTVDIASGVSYQGWTFNGTVPAPFIHVRQGQTVNVTFENRGAMEHSIDFHAAQVDPETDYRNVAPGESIKFSWKAEVAGAFMYHCGTSPVLFHIANGMYGAIIVDPATPLPPADESYVIVQGEWYTSQVQGNTMTADYDKMLDGKPDEVVFNGIAFQYVDHPLTAKVGDRVRFYVVDAGPTYDSSFHVIGSMLETVYPDGDPSHTLNHLQTYQIAPGSGAIIDVVINTPGTYPFVDHSMLHANAGAIGKLKVSQ
jgi:nitrite reductase (NO-forming)